jgi:ankyrin repeat protein
MKRNGLRELFGAIFQDDRARVVELLREDPALISVGAREAILSQEVMHWIYVGDTALHVAAAGHRVEICNALLAAGADVNADGNHRRSRPLHYAADGAVGAASWNAARQVKTIGVLLDAGADIDAVDKNGATALHRAVRTRCAAAVKLLLERGADGKVFNKPGSTAFHLAVQNTGRGGSGSAAAMEAQREIIGIFMAHGARPSLKDARGRTVLDWARSERVREWLA